MRAAAASAASSAAGPLALADAKVAGSGAGAAAPETSNTAGASDRSADSSQQGTPGQPFAAALASAQAGIDRKPGTHAVAVAAPIEDAGGDAKALQRSAVARPDSRAQAAPAPGTPSLNTDPETTSIPSAAAASSDGAVAAPLLIAVAPDPAVDSTVATERLPSKLDGDAGGQTTSAATGSKSRAGKHSQPAQVSDAAALSTLAALLGAAAAQTSAAAPPTSGTVSAAPRPIGNGADADSAAAAVSAAAKRLLSIGSAAEVTATASSPMGPSTADRATTGGDTDGASADSSSAARALDANAISASPGTDFAPLIQSLSAVTNAAAPSPTTSMGVPVAHPSWPNALATQVQWMATRQLQSATLRLSPEHLGPLEVRIDVTRSQINVNFTAHHPDTREALTQTVPQLRQLFAAGGLNLGEATVRQEPRSSEQPPLPQPSSATAASETVEPVANTAIQRLGLVDEYA